LDIAGCFTSVCSGAMRKSTHHICLYAASVLLFCRCVVARKYTWLLYMHADNNLEADIVADVQELTAAFFGNGDPADFAVHVLIDRDQPLNNGMDNPDDHVGPINNIPDFTTAKTFLVGKSKLESVVDKGEINMDLSKTLEDFIKEGIAKYPADNYMLTMSDHGGGLTGGFGGDPGPGPGTMTIAKLVEGLKKGLGSNKLALMGFDACLMQHYSVARAVAPYTKYFIASEELEPGHGWDYTVLKDVFKSPQTKTVPQIGEVLINGFLNHWKTLGYDSPQAGLSLALIDTAKLEVFTTKFNDLANSLRCELKSAKKTQVMVGIGRARSQYIQTNGGKSGGKRFIDMGTMIDHISTGFTKFVPSKYFSSDTISRASTAKTAFNAMFIHKGLGAALLQKKAQGMAVLWPASCAPDGMSLTNTDCQSKLDSENCVSAEGHGPLAVYTVTKLVSPKFADLLADLDHLSYSMGSKGCNIDELPTPSAVTCGPAPGPGATPAPTPAPTTVAITTTTTQTTAAGSLATEKPTTKKPTAKPTPKPPSSITEVSSMNIVVDDPRLANQDSIAPVSFQFSGTATKPSTLTTGTALYGKSTDGKTVTWLIQEAAYFDEATGAVSASAEDASVKVTQYHDGTKGSCDVEETVFCEYKKIAANIAKSTPAQFGCDIPVKYYPKNSKVAQFGTLSLYLNADTYELSTSSLFANSAKAGKAAKVAEVPKFRGGRIEPILYQTPLIVTNVIKDRTVMKSVKPKSFNWGRPLEINWGDALKGKTYLAVVVEDFLGNEAHAMKTPPAYKINDIFPFGASCADEEAKMAGDKMKITGVVSFAVAGLTKDQVLAASKEAVSRSLDVPESLITVSAAQTRRLLPTRWLSEDSASRKEQEIIRRRLAGSWAVTYSLTVSATRANRVETAAQKFNTSPSKFKGNLLHSLKKQAQAAGKNLVAADVTLKAFALPTLKNTGGTTSSVTGGTATGGTAGGGGVSGGTAGDSTAGATGGTTGVTGGTTGDAAGTTVGSTGGTTGGATSTAGGATSTMGAVATSSGKFARMTLLSSVVVVLGVFVVSL